MVRLLGFWVALVLLAPAAEASVVGSGMPDNLGPWGFTHPNGNALVREASGACHAVYTSGGKLVYAFSEGTCSGPFASRVLGSGASIPSIVSDASGVLTIVYVEDSGAVVALRGAGGAYGWARSVVSEGLADASITSLSVAVDSRGAVHSAWSGERGEKESFVGYSSFSGGSWQPASELGVARLTRQGSEQYLSVALCLGQDDSMHLFYSNGSDAAYAAARVGEDWLIQGNVFPLSAQSNLEGRLSCAVDVSGNVHVVESDLTATDYVRYRNSSSFFSDEAWLDEGSSMARLVIKGSSVYVFYLKFDGKSLRPSFVVSPDAGSSWVNLRGELGLLLGAEPQANSYFSLSPTSPDGTLGMLWGNWTGSETVVGIEGVALPDASQLRQLQLVQSGGIVKAGGMGSYSFRFAPFNPSAGSTGIAPRNAQQPPGGGGSIPYGPIAAAVAATNLTAAVIYVSLRNPPVIAKLDRLAGRLPKNVVESRSISGATSGVSAGHSSAAFSGNVASAGGTASNPSRPAAVSSPLPEGGGSPGFARAGVERPFIGAARRSDE
ncbi:hypothetical protein HYS54_01290 [Candidatus Micrarchaeota archaeon]|nr:hypothetical protein [Candidatus Micrarchaeota archaeon]